VIKDRSPVPDLTVIELAIVIVCTRRPRSGTDEIASEISRWFDRPVTASHVELPLHRLIARGEVTSDGDRFGSTDLGRNRAEDAARSLVRLIFRDRYFFDVGKLLDVTLVKEDANHAH
jgi:hypothetical protein